jgi:hypothetical protein
LQPRRRLLQRLPKALLADAPGWQVVSAEHFVRSILFDVFSSVLADVIN